MPKTILVNTARPCCYSNPKLIEHSLQSAFVISYIEPAHPHLRKMVSLPLFFTPMQGDKHETTSRRFTLPPHQQESTYTSQSGYPMGIYPVKCMNLLDEVSWSLAVFYLKFCVHGLHWGEPKWAPHRCAICEACQYVCLCAGVDL